MKIKFNSIGHPWFACAHFSTFFTPVLLAYVVDKVAALIDGKTKVKRHEWNSWRVYAGLIPGFFKGIWLLQIRIRKYSCF